MSEEMKNEELKKEHKHCTCGCDTFQKLAVITAGSFIGCILALCVFNSFSKPPIPAPAPAPIPMQIQQPIPPIQGECNRQEFRHHKKLDKKDIKRPDREATLPIER